MGNDTSLSNIHPLNTESSIWVTFSGTIIFVRNLHPLKAPDFISVMFVPIIMSVSSRQPLNASLPMAVTLYVILSFMVIVGIVIFPE